MRDFTRTVFYTATIRLLVFCRFYRFCFVRVVFFLKHWNFLPRLVGLINRISGHHIAVNWAHLVMRYKLNLAAINYLRKGIYPSVDDWENKKSHHSVVKGTLVIFGVWLNHISHWVSGHLFKWTRESERERERAVNLKS